ncbi:hypothetical protein ACG04Q_13070 [Roseateles sp. DXS20W]|uniref:Ankyrin repeat domain-containing protein n=1 Tax=Pelomonas lactea TaxID=3299030 RepID=A0ABW7GKP9_9BURK
MGLFELFGMGAAGASLPDARAPQLAPPEAFFQGAALDLLRAALASNEASMKQAIAQGADPSAHGPAAKSRNVPQLTLLHYAIGVRNAKAAALLLACGADPLQEPRKEDGDAFLFAVIRRDAEMLTALLRHFPLDRMPAARKAALAFQSLDFKARECLQVLFDHGMPVGILDSAGHNLFMYALEGEDFDTAEWLLAEVKVPISGVMDNAGITPANMVQRALAEVFKPGSSTYRRYEKFKRIMEERGIVFPVESSAEWRARMKAQPPAGPAR